MTERSLLITGCSSGIGYNAAHGMRAAGWRVFASCRREEDCARLKDEGFESPLLDYSNSDSLVTGLTEVLEATDGRLDALYNNGAYGCPGAVEDLPRDALRENFETNVFGLQELTNLVIPVMRKQGHGRIVNCSSVLGFVGMKWRGSYVATKFALEGLTDVLRMEMSDTPIKVILIEPGPITSDIRQKSIPHFEKWINWEGSARRDEYEGLRKRLYADYTKDQFELPPDAVTKKLRKALESKRPKPRYYVTAPTYFAGAMKRILPTRTLDWVLKQD